MIRIPEEYIGPLITILEWHLKAYMPQVIFDTRTERILEKLHKANTLDSSTDIERNEIYNIHVCVSDATNNFEECGINKDLVWDIHNWSFAEYKKSK